jgi:AcrR family transcriptional regulator
MRNGRGKGERGKREDSSSRALVVRNGDGKKGGEIEQSIRPVFDRLSFDQQTALEQLLSGMSVTQAAASADVARSTLYKWLKKDAAFRAAYNEWHENMLRSTKSRLVALTDTATDAVKRSLMGGDGRLGFAFLKGMGLIRDHKPGSSEPQEVKEDMEWKDHRRKARGERRRLRKAIDDELGKLTDSEILSVGEELRRFREKRANAECQMTNDE